MDISKIKFWSYRESITPHNTVANNITKNIKLQSDFERVMQQQNVPVSKYALPPYEVDSDKKIEQQNMLKYAVPDNGVVKDVNNTPPIPEVTKYGLPDIKE